jgi:nucleolar complex protein 2
MVKTSKRSRKFEAKGGAKGMLEKGTITKKGKLRKKRRTDTNDDTSAAMDAKNRKLEALRNEAEVLREQEDFVGKSNLGDLDLESFLQSVNEEGVSGGEESDDDKDDISAHEESDSDDDDDDISIDQNESSDDEEVNAESMEAGLAKLAENDPEFHKYLKENEKDLLEFENDDDDVDHDDDKQDMDQDDDDEEPTTKKANKAANSQNVIVTAELLKTYERGAFKSHGIKALRRIISAYTSACHMADVKDENEDGDGRLRTSGKKSYHIESSKVFDKLMILCLTKCHEEFHYHLLGKGASVGDNDSDSDGEDGDDNNGKNEAIDANKPFNPRHLAKSVRWVQLKLPIQSFVKATLHLLSEAKEAKLLTFIIKSLENFVPYLSAYPRLSKALLKTLTALWSSTTDATPDYETVRLNAFLRIRQLALTQPFPFIEQCLKTTYLSYAKCAKFANAATVTSLLPTLTFMGNCVVELYSLDFASSYQHAFVYIRQLALHLRSALQKKTPEAFRIVYCWQYMHCIKLWAAVLAATCGGSSDADGAMDETSLMRSLIYPLVEIILGVAKLVPTTRHLPLRLHCVRFLQQLASSSETFIPTTSLLLETFDLKEVTMNPKRVKTRGTDVQGVRLPIILKLPKDGALRTAEQLDACLGEIFLLLNREVDLYKYSAGCPEFTIRICQRLRKVSHFLSCTMIFTEHIT